MYTCKIVYSITIRILLALLPLHIHLYEHIFFWSSNVPKPASRADSDSFSTTGLMFMFSGKKLCSKYQYDFRRKHINSLNPL